MGKPGTPALMERARSKRAPFTEIRDGKLLRQIRYAFVASHGKPLTTGELLRSCYPTQCVWGEIKQWHYEMVGRAARRVCKPLGIFLEGSRRCCRKAPKQVVPGRHCRHLSSSRLRASP